MTRAFEAAETPLLLLEEARMRANCARMRERIAPSARRSVRT